MGHHMWHPNLWGLTKPMQMCVVCLMPASARDFVGPWGFISASFCQNPEVFCEKAEISQALPTFQDTAGAGAQEMGFI